MLCLLLPLSPRASARILITHSPSFIFISASHNSVPYRQWQETGIGLPTGRLYLTAAHRCPYHVHNVLEIPWRVSSLHIKIRIDTTHPLSLLTNSLCTQPLVCIYPTIPYHGLGRGSILVARSLWCIPSATGCQAIYPRLPGAPMLRPLIRNRDGPRAMLLLHRST